MLYLYFFYLLQYHLVVVTKYRHKVINNELKDRLIKMLQREPNKDDVEECTRRSLSDVGMFDGVEDEVDKVIFNEGYKKTPKDICNEIFDEIRK